MLVSKEEFDKIFKNGNEKIYTACTLIKSMGVSPKRFTGPWHYDGYLSTLYRFKGLSGQIKFGDAIEEATRLILSKQGLECLERTYDYLEENGEIVVLNIDQLMCDKKSKKIYLIEQKVHDDHDSTKKRGQHENFDKKMKCITEKYPDYHVIGIIWFTDKRLKKNRKYYSEELKKANYEAYLCYEGEMFEKFPEFGGVDVYNQLNEYVIDLRKTRPEPTMNDFNFDDIDDSGMEELISEFINENRGAKLSQVRAFLNDSELQEEFHGIISPSGSFISKLRALYDSAKQTKKKKR